MTTLKVKISTRPGFPEEWIPFYKTSGSSGMDLRAFNFDGEDVVVNPGEIKIIPTGIMIELPEGYEAQVRSRSGLSSKFGIMVINSPGTIDSDYRGQIYIPVLNAGPNSFTIRHGDRIAQLIVTTYTKVDWELVDELDDTDRGENGLGHSGVR